MKNERRRVAGEGRLGLSASNATKPNEDRRLQGKHKRHPTKTLRWPLCVVGFCNG